MYVTQPEYRRYQVPQRPRAPPLIIWDFDTAPTGSGGRGITAVLSLLKQLTSWGVPDLPVISFHYTAQEFSFPGKEQAITVIRRHVPDELGVQVKARSVAHNRDEVRAQLRWKIREHQERADGSIMILISGDPNVLQWQRSLASSATYPRTCCHICPEPIWNAKWVSAMDCVPDFLWHFNYGVLPVPRYPKVQTPSPVLFSW